MAVIAYVVWPAWENEQAFSIFGTEHLSPGKAGVQAEMQLTFHPAHEVYALRAARITV